MQASKSFHECNFLAIFMRGEYFFVALFFVLLWGAILGGSGSLFSGYHLADDHEILSVQEDLSMNTWGSVFTKWFRKDLNGSHRFRPFYFIHRVLLTKWLGANFTTWLFYAGVLAVLTSFLLYYGCRLTSFSWLDSILFVLLTLLGPQAVVWWSLGPNENIAMLLLAASWVCMLFAIRHPRYKFCFRSTMVVFVILSALSKESFILMIPAFVYLMVWSYRLHNGTSWQKAWIANFWAVLILLIFTISVLLIIGASVGFGGYGAQGGGISHFDLSLFIRAAITAIDVSLSFSTIGTGLVILLCAFLFLFFSSKRIDRSFTTNAVPSLILFGLIITPQFMIYARCGIFGRYILPLMLGYSGLLISFLEFLQKDDSRFSFERKNLIKILLTFMVVFVLIGYLFISRSFFEKMDFLQFKRFSAVAIILAIGIFMVILYWAVCASRRNKCGFSLYRFGFWLTVCLVVYKLVLSFVGARAFAQEGKENRVLFSFLEKHTGPQDNIMVINDEKNFRGEAAFAIKEFLRIKCERPQTSFFVPPTLTGICPPHQDDTTLSGLASCVVIFSIHENDVLQCPPAWFKRKEYERIQIGSFIVYFLTK